MFDMKAHQNSIKLMPLWWVFGVQFFIFHLVSIYGFLKLLRSRRGEIRVPPYSVFLIVYIVFLIIPLVGASIYQAEGDSSRIYSALYNISFWFMGLLVLVSVYNLRRSKEVNELYLSLRYYPIFAGLAALVGLFFWFSGETEFFILSPVSYLVPGDTENLLKASSLIKFLQRDWIADGAMPRSSVMAVYPTALAASIMASLPASYVAYKENKMTILIFMLALSCGLLALILTWSRTSIVAFIFSIFLVALLSSKYRYLLFIIAVCTCVLLSPIIIDGFYTIYMLREGSSSHRLANYIWGVQLVMDESPVLGLGVKPRVEIHNVPVGSHSMYVGSFVRGGFAGLISFVFWQILVVAHVIKNIYGSTLYYKCAAVGVISISIWMLSEDLDAPQFVCFVYFVLLGVCFSERVHHE